MYLAKNKDAIQHITQCDIAWINKLNDIDASNNFFSFFTNEHRD